jgi:hypothetical protein
MVNGATYIGLEDYARVYNDKHNAELAEKAMAYVRKHGPMAARTAAHEAFSKDATTQGWSTSTGAVFYDLRGPMYLIAPVIAMIRATTPRWGKVNAGYGVQPHWKAIYNFDAGTNPTFPGVGEGERNAYSSVSEKDFTAPYITLGTDDSVTYESVSASEGYDDNLGTAHEVQMLRFLNLEEKTLLYGSGTLGANGNPLQLATTNTPTATVTTTPTGATNALTVGNYYALYCVALNGRAADALRTYVVQGTVPATIPLQYTRTSAAGETQTINTGSAKYSAASAVVQTTSGNPAVLGHVAPMAGAYAYAWFAQTSASTFTAAAASATLVAVTSASAFVYYGQNAGTSTQTASVFSADWSTNVLDADGLLTVASNTNYTSGWAPYNAYTSDLHGAGFTNAGTPGAITEIDLCLAQFAQMQSTPTAIYLSTDVVPSFRNAFIKGATGSPNLLFFAAAGTAQNDLSLNTAVAAYRNIFALPGDQQFIPIYQHPWLPAGTCFVDCSNLGVAYQHSRMGETRGVYVRRDTYGQEFARTTRKYPFGVYSEEVLGVKMPQLLGLIKSIGAFGQAALF